MPHAPRRLATLAAWALSALPVAACASAESPPQVARAAVADTLSGAEWTSQDWEVFAEKVRWGAAQRLDTLPIGQAIARLAVTFVGATYTPATLEVPGPERLVINLRAFDCVTLIENVLALVRFIREDGAALLDHPAAGRARYESHLRELRYRGGRLDGYPSRLHYFSEWLADNALRGRLDEVTEALGGERDTTVVHFMTSHPASYRQMADSAVRNAIAGVERRLSSGRGRWFLPQQRMRQAEPGIQDGDLVAATSTLPGLDVAHTGIALWVDGRLHLLHAPLVGRNVEISALPLAERIQGIAAQDGIMVARVR